MADNYANVTLPTGTLKVDTTLLIAAAVKALGATTFTPSATPSPAKLVQAVDFDGSTVPQASQAEGLKAIGAGHLGIVWALDYTAGNVSVVTSNADTSTVLDVSGATPFLTAFQIPSFVGGDTVLTVTSSNAAKLACFIAEMTAGTVVGAAVPFTGPANPASVITTDFFTVTEDMLPCTMLSFAVNTTAGGSSPLLAPVPEYQSEQEIIRFQWAFGTGKPWACFCERLITTAGQYAASFTTTSNVPEQYLVQAFFIQPK